MNDETPAGAESPDDAGATQPGAAPEVEVDGNVEGDVTVAPPPANATPEAEAGQPEGDVKPKSEGAADPQSSEANQDLQTGGEGDTPVDPGQVQ